MQTPAGTVAQKRPPNRLRAGLGLMVCCFEVLLKLESTKPHDIESNIRKPRRGPLPAVEERRPKSNESQNLKPLLKGSWDIIIVVWAINEVNIFATSQNPT